jgi:hypothetical protein
VLLPASQLHRSFLPSRDGRLHRTINVLAHMRWMHDQIRCLPSHHSLRHAFCSSRPTRAAQPSCATRSGQARQTTNAIGRRTLSLKANRTTQPNLTTIANGKPTVRTRSLTWKMARSKQAASSHTCWTQAFSQSYRIREPMMPRSWNIERISASPRTGGRPDYAGGSAIKIHCRRMTRVPYRTVALSHCVSLRSPASKEAKGRQYTSKQLTKAYEP